MKIFWYVLLPFAGILFLVFGFMLLWQKEQNEHNERMESTRQSHVIKVQVVNKETKFLKEMIWEGLKSGVSFFYKLFS